VVANAEKLRAKMLAARVELLARLDARQPASSDDRTPRRPVHELPPTPSRADGLWPFLLIRSTLGDDGARPMLVPDHSPDILFTEVPTPQPGAPDDRVRGRNEHPGDTEYPLTDRPYDVWVHVWNLGRTAAYGVRVRAWAHGQHDPVPGLFLGGWQLDLGDRASKDSHVLVKIGRWTPNNWGYTVRGPQIPGSVGFSWIYATAECITDVANGSFVPGQDRHTASRFVTHMSVSSHL
jgi:hypothetical protein